MMKTRLLLPCLAILLACAPAAAQVRLAPPSPLEPGMRVRVHGPSTGKERWVGRVSMVNGDTVLLNLRKRGRWAMLLSTGDTVEVSRGRGNRAGAAWFGLFAGTFGGGFAGALLADGEAGLGGMVSGIAIGAPLGVIMGITRGFELWTRVLPAPQGGPRSTGAAVGVGLTLTVR